MKVGSQKILGTTVEIHANSNGYWAVMSEGKRLGGAANLDAAIAQARKQLNMSRIDVSVRFYTTDGKKGVATKIHGKTRNVMARVDGKSAQLEPSTDVFKPDTPVSMRRRWAELNSEMMRLRIEQREIASKHMFRLGTKVMQEVEAANKIDEANNGD